MPLEIVMPFGSCLGATFFLRRKVEKGPCLDTNKRVSNAMSFFSYTGTHLEESGLQSLGAKGIDSSTNSPENLVVLLCWHGRNIKPHKAVWRSIYLTDSPKMGMPDCDF